MGSQQLHSVRADNVPMPSLTSTPEQHRILETVRGVGYALRLARS